MRIKEQDDSTRQVIAEIKNLSKLTKKGVQKAFIRVGKDLKKDVVDSIKYDKKTGRTYLIKVNGALIRHRASAPLETPANLTGSLVNSIGYEVSGSSYSMTYFADTGYSKFLEDGTKKMRPRTYLLKTINKNERNTIRHFEQEIRMHIKKTGLID